MSNIQFDPSETLSISKQLSGVSSLMDRSKCKVSNVHTVLWADDALTNAFSKSLLNDISAASKTLKRQQDRMLQYSSAIKAVEQDISSSDRSSVKSTIRKILGWTWFVSGAAFTGGLPVVLGGLLWNHYHSSSSITDSTARTIGEKASDTGKTAVDQAAEAAQQVVDETPQQVPFSNESIHDYSEGVNRGSIRYVDQTSNLEENGWGDTAYLTPGTDGHPGGQCNSACESMALSYMGIDRTPGSLVPNGYDELGGLEVANYGTGSRDWIAPDGSVIHVENNVGCNMDDISTRISNFETDYGQGNTAPVMIHYRNGSAMHWLLVTGKNPDGTFNVIGPGGSRERGTTVNIDSYGTISGGSISHGGGQIDRYAQYTRTT